MTRKYVTIWIVYLNKIIKNEINVLKLKTNQYVQLIPSLSFSAKKSFSTKPSRSSKTAFPTTAVQTDLKCL